MTDLPMWCDVVILVGTAIGAAMGGVIYKGHVEREIPKAKNGFITLDELHNHCVGEQGHCVKVLNMRFDAMETLIRDRLDRGDAQFRWINERLERLSVAAKVSGFDGER